MKKNIPIPEIPHGEDLWLIVLVTQVRERRTQQGRLYCDATARNSTGMMSLKIWGEVLEAQRSIRPGLWAIRGKLEFFQDRRKRFWTLCGKREICEVLIVHEHGRVVARSFDE